MKNKIKMKMNKNKNNKNLMETLNTSMAVGPDGNSSFIIRRCCRELSPVYTVSFFTCM